MNPDAELKGPQDEQAEASGSTLSFVKRSKPRTSGIRRRDSSIPDAAAELDSKAAEVTSNTAKDAEQEDDGVSAVFRPRAAGRRSAAASNAASSSKSTPLKSRTLLNDDEEQDETEPAIEIRRSKLNTAAKQMRAQNSVTSSPSSSRKGTPIRLPALNDVEAVAASTSTPSYTSRYLAELKASTPTSKLRNESPASAHDSGLDPMDNLAQQVAGLDHDDELSLARSKFGDDLTYDSIPSDEAVRAAKDKRTKLRAEYLRKARSSEGDDFISLSSRLSTSRSVQQPNNMQVDDGPHPNSRLPREEDEYGDGEEEFAEYTGATDRIPIGEKAEKQHAKDQRKEMEAAFDGRMNTALNAADEDDMEVDEEEEWERAQMRRNEMPSYTSKQKAFREASPYRAAAIPTSTPLPTRTSTSARLKQTLRKLEQSSSAHLKVVNSTTKSLAELDEAEQANKADLVDLEAKESWFRELEEFLANLARFMDEKAPGLEKLETEAVKLLAERTAIVTRARSKVLEDDLILFWGFPTMSALPLPADERIGADTSDVSRSDVSPDDLMQQAMQRALHRKDDQVELLSPSDEAAFRSAQADIATRLHTLFIDTQAPEYLDPMARASDESGAALHPRSVVARFQDWRRRYGAEYTQVWGGLSVAQIWEFYARKEMVLWDPFSSVDPSTEDAQAWKSGSAQVPGSAWFKGILSYMTVSLDEAQEEIDNGDADMLSTVVSNVISPRVLRLVQSSAFDPWSGEQSREATRLLLLLKPVVDADRYQSLVTALLDAFATHIQRLRDLLKPPRGSLVIVQNNEFALFSFLSQLTKNLLTNLVSFHASCSVSLSADASASSPLLALLHNLLDSLIGHVLIKILQDMLPDQDRVLTLIKAHVLAQIPTTLSLASPALASQMKWLDSYVGSSTTFGPVVMAQGIDLRRAGPGRIAQYPSRW